MNRPECDHHGRNVCFAGRRFSPLAFFSIAILLVAQPAATHAAPLAGACRDVGGTSHCLAAPSRATLTGDDLKAQAPKKELAQDTQPAVVTLPKDEPVSMEEVRAEMQRVFGEDYDKAMMILTHPNCHENRYLDPKAVHRNWVPGQPGVYSSSDWGVFQINDRAHGFTEAEASQVLTNYKYNIKVAKKLYDLSGGKFRLWTCGRVLGI